MSSIVSFPGNDKIKNSKPNIYIACNHKDFKDYFGYIAADILSVMDCEIFFESDWYTAPSEEELSCVLSQMGMVILPISNYFLDTENRGKTFEFGYAIENHIPVLPIFVEKELEAAFTAEMNRIKPGFGDVVGIERGRSEEEYRAYLSVMSVFLNAAFPQAVENNQSIEFKNRLIERLIDLSDLLLEKNQIPDAKDVLEVCIEIAEGIISDNSYATAKNRAKALYKMGDLIFSWSSVFEGCDDTEAEYYFGEALEILDDLSVDFDDVSSDRDIAFLISRVSLYFIYKKDIDAAAKLAKAGLQQFEDYISDAQISDDSFEYAICSTHIGGLYLLLGDDEKAIDHIVPYRKYFELHRDDFECKKMLAVCHGMLGVISYVTDQYDSAEAYVNEQIELCNDLYEKTNSISYIKAYMENMAMLVTLFEKKNQYAKAKDCAQKSLDLYDLINRALGMDAFKKERIVMNCELSVLHRLLEQAVSCETYAKKACAIYAQLAETEKVPYVREAVALCLIMRGARLIEVHEYESAYEVLNESKSMWEWLITQKPVLYPDSQTVYAASEKLKEVERIINSISDKVHVNREEADNKEENQPKSSVTERLKAAREAILQGNREYAYNTNRSAIECYEQATKLCLDIADENITPHEKVSVALFLSYLGKLWMEENKIREAISCFDIALSFLEEARKNNLISDEDTDIADIYKSLSEIWITRYKGFKKLKDKSSCKDALSKAEDYLKKAIEGLRAVQSAADSAKLRDFISDCYGRLADVCFMKGETIRALKYLSRSKGGKQLMDPVD